jgi:quinol monooxygenase YgiN
MSGPCTVFVRLTPLPGKRDFTRALILELLPEIRALEGCEEYRLFDAVDGDLMLYERFTTRDHWQAHFDAPAIVRLKAELADAVELPGGAPGNLRGLGDGVAHSAQEVALESSLR